MLEEEYKTGMKLWSVNIWSAARHVRYAKGFWAYEGMDPVCSTFRVVSQ